MGPKIRFILGTFMLTLSIISFIPKVNANEETYFVVTAYYSPLPGQAKYTTGSYAGDIRLNGEGVTTASGNGVFPGLLAGPKNYPFGTKLYFEGYGIGVIEDRGGAIVKAGQRGYSYDRIDIWMGYGDEGLNRALKWGKRTIKGKIVIPSSQVSIKFPESKLGALTKLEVNPESSEESDVKKLQTIFTKAELYNGEINGEYESIRNELINFQINSGIITSKDDDAAGWYGNKTIAALREKYGADTGGLIKESTELFKNYNHRAASEKYKIILEYGDLQVGPDSDSSEIIELQELFSELGEYSGSINGKYSSIETPLINFQKKIGLITNSDDWGAGYFGNKTKSAMWTYYEIQDDGIVSPELSSYEKNRMEKAYEVVKTKLQKDELRTGKSSQARLEKLNVQITNAIPTITDSDLVLKLQYLQKLIN